MHGALRRHLVAWLILLAFVTRLVLPVAMPMLPPSPFAQAAGVVDAVLGPIALCAPGTTQADGEQQAPGDGTPHDGHCPLCHLAKSLVLAFVLTAIAVLLPLRPAPLSRWTSQRSLPDHLWSGSVRTRAPPVSPRAV
ncbi:MAG: DUF2946 family protein [Hyphomicrobiaceae bacterium]